MSDSTTRIPSSAKLSLIARPSPLPAPVTTATRPLRSSTRVPAVPRIDEHLAVVRLPGRQRREGLLEILERDRPAVQGARLDAAVGQERHAPQEVVVGERV